MLLDDQIKNLVKKIELTDIKDSESLNTNLRDLIKSAAGIHLVIVAEYRVRVGKQSPEFLSGEGRGCKADRGHASRVRELV